MEFHPAADIFPLLEGNEFEVFKADIKRHGQRETIWTFEGKILDGRNRYRACSGLGIEPRTQEWRDDDHGPVAFVVSEISIADIWTNPSAPWWRRRWRPSSQRDRGIVRDKEIIGPGWWVRNQHEHLWIAMPGDMAVPQPAARPSSVHRERRTTHSTKPESAYEIIERMHPDLRRLELFARRRRPGWVWWGDKPTLYEVDTE